MGADGANSIVRKQMQVNHVAFSYDQMGLIATVEVPANPDNFTAWQRFLPNGVLALLPVSDQLSSIVWSTDAHNFKHLMSLDESAFVDAINKAFVGPNTRKHSAHSIYVKLEFPLQTDTKGPKEWCS